MASVHVGLFARQVALLAVTAITPLLLLGLAVIDQNRRALERDANAYHQLAAERGRDALEAHLDGVRAQLEALALTLSAPDLGDEAARLGAVKAAVATSPHLLALARYGPGAERAWTLKARGDDAVAAPATVSLGEPSPPLQLLSVERTPQGAVLWVAVPADGGALAARVSLSSVGAVLAEVAARPPLGAAGAVFVVDARGASMLGHDLGRERPHALFAALEGDAPFRKDLSLSLEFDDLGTPMLGAVSSVPSLEWAVVIERPRELAYATLAQTRRAVMLAVGLACLGALGIGLYGARRLTRPLQLLEGDTRRLAEGTFEHVAPEVSRRSDELGALARSFDAMSKQLAAARQKALDDAAQRAALSRYLAPEVVEQVLANPQALSLGGARRDVVVMFADVVGFTAMSQSISPEATVALLNELFTVQTEVVHRTHGMVDKFIGDSLMAVWGLPEPSEQDVPRALEAAQQIREWVEGAQRRWRDHYGATVQMGIGLHVGSAVAGNIGSARRLEYTVIGDTVNVAARLEAVARPGQILVSGELFARKGESDAELKFVREEVLRGRSAPTRLYEVL